MPRPQSHRRLSISRNSRDYSYLGKFTGQSVPSKPDAQAKECRSDTFAAKQFMEWRKHSHYRKCQRRYLRRRNGCPQSAPPNHVGKQKGLEAVCPKSFRFILPRTGIEPALR